MDPQPPGNGSGPIVKQIKDIKSRIDKLESFSGADYVRAVQKINDLIAGLPAQVADITNAYLATALGSYYSKTQVDALVASPGAITPTTVTASGNVSGGSLGTGGDANITGVVKSPGSRSYIVGTAYAGAWIDGDGTLGISPSSRRLKKNITKWLGDSTKLLELDPVMFRYKTQSAEDPKQIGLIAEDVVDAGFPEFTFNDSDGNVQGIAYDRLTVALIALSKSQQQQIQALTDRLDAAGI